jgi:hypothetical protein
VTGERRIPVTKMVGVYDADGSLLGELRYWVGAHVTGTAHCALCEITHGLFREKAAWREVSGGLPVPFEAVHLDERCPEIEDASRDRTPCVLAVLADGSADLLLGPEDLEELGGDPSRLASALSEALQRRYPSEFAPT